MADELRAFCQSSIDPVAIDREARIPDSVIHGLGQLGVLGACLPKDCGGRGLTQTQYCQILEILGGHCASTALFVNAHHSIGPRAIVLFGTDEQKKPTCRNWPAGNGSALLRLQNPKLAAMLAMSKRQPLRPMTAKALSSTATKRWITNGGIAQVLTVIARTPTSSIGLRGGSSKPTAFLVTPDMPGFKVLEERMPSAACAARQRRG